MATRILLATVAVLLGGMAPAMAQPAGPGIVRVPDAPDDLRVDGTTRSEVVVGTADGDHVSAGPGDDVIRTGRGRDRIWAGDGRDRVYAGPGDDRIVVSGNNAADFVDCGTGRDVVIADPVDDLRGCEVVVLKGQGRAPHLRSVAAEIRAMERRTGSDSSNGVLWRVTHGNALPGLGDAQPAWVTRTTDCWGRTTACDSSAVQQQLTSAIRGIIGGATTLVDISSLAPVASGGFRQAIIDGAADAQRAGNRPVIRLLWGRSPAAPFSARALRALQRDVQAAAPDLTVVGALMANTLVTNGYSWNHSKIVAADSRVAWAAGINMWSDSYLQSRNPVTDLGVVVRGPAARDAHVFLDELWAFSCANEGSGLRYNVTIVPAKGGSRGCPARRAPDAGAPEGDISVMAVGRGGYIDSGRTTGRLDPREVSAADRRDSGCIVPPLPNPMNGDPSWDGNNPSDTALRALVESAESNVVISQQDLIFPCAKDPSYDVRLVDAIARKVRDGIPVTIAVSNPKATITLFEQYPGDPAPARAVIMKRLTALMGSRDLATRAACRSLAVAPFRLSSLATWPGGGAPGLHAKVIAVDDSAVLVGSQNAYPNQLQEFGYIIEDPRAMADMKRTFLDPLEANARAGALPCR